MEEFCYTWFSGGSYEGAKARIASFRTIRDVGRCGTGRLGLFYQIERLTWYKCARKSLVYSVLKFMLMVDNLIVAMAKYGTCINA